MLSPVAKLSAWMSETFGFDSSTAQLVTGALALGVGWWVVSRVLSLLGNLGGGRPGGSGRRLAQARSQARKAVARGDADAAAQVLALAGDLDGARKLREKAAEEAKAAGDPVTAARHLHALGRQREAGRLLLRARHFDEAADVFREADLSPDAARALELGGKLAEAAQLYVGCRRADDALRCLTRATSAQAPPALRGRREELSLQAAKLARHLNRPGQVADFLELAGRPDAAARYHAEAGRHRRAGELFEQAGDWEPAAKAWKAEGDDAAHRRCAARAARAQGDHALAATLFERGDELAEAAPEHEAAGNAADAARCYAAVESWSAAAPLFRQVGEEARAADCHERAGEHWEAALLYERLGEMDRALDCFAAVSTGAVEFLEARGRAGLIRAARGEHATARALLERVVQSLDQAGLCPDLMVDYLTSLGDCHEVDSELERALDHLRRAALLDPGASGIVERIETLEKRLQASDPGRDRHHAPDRYQVIQELACGGMGSVYLARDVALERFVALKVLGEAWRRHPELRERFIREAKVAARLSHPNVVSVHDVGDFDGRPYMALEYVEGRDLAGLLKEKGHLTVAEARPSLVAIARALTEAHEIGIVHRDVKPANVFLGKDGCIKLGDFGIAQVEGVDVTESGMAVGTPRYMAPEQACGRHVDGRSDIYAMGVVGFELLTGRPPFVGGDVGYQHVHAPPPDPRDFKPDLPPLLARLLLSCLAKDPEARPPTARRFEQLLDAACEAAPSRVVS